MTKRILAIVLAMAMTLSLLCIDAFAISGSVEVVLNLWGASSDPVKVDGVGTYTVSVSGVALSPSGLGIILENPLNKNGAATLNGAMVTTKSVKINGIECETIEKTDWSGNPSQDSVNAPMNFTSNIAYYNAYWHDGDLIKMPEGVTTVSSVEITFEVTDFAPEAKIPDAPEGDLVYDHYVINNGGYYSFSQGSAETAFNTFVSAVQKDGAMVVVSADTPFVWYNFSFNGVDMKPLTSVNSDSTSFTAKAADVYAVIKENIKEGDAWGNGFVFQVSHGTPVGIRISVVVKPTDEPAGYESNKNLDVEAKEVDGELVVTPSGSVKTEGILVAFEEPAPADGTVTVVVGDGSSYPLEKVTADVSSAFISSDSYIVPIDAINGKVTTHVTLSGKVLNAAMTQVRFFFASGSNGGYGNNLHNPVTDITINDDGTFTYEGDVEFTGGATQFYIKAQAGTNITNEGWVVLDSLTTQVVDGPALGETYTVSYSAGDTYVEVTGISNKRDISNIIIASDKLPTLAGLKVKASDNNNKKTFLYAIRLSDDFHGFLINGRMMPMAHIDNGSGVCTHCGMEINAAPYTKERAKAAVAAAAK